MDDVPRAARPHLGFAPDTAVREPTNLDELMALAVLHHPDLQAARARVEVAQGKMIQAGLYPNPVIGPRFTEIGESANATGQAGAIFTQQIITANKLGLAKAAGALGVEAADWQAFTKWYDVLTRVRLSYFELLTALREQETTQEIVRVSEEAFKAAKTLEKKGAGNRPDILRANVELEQNRLKTEIAQRRVEAARQNLITALGRPAVALQQLEKNSHDLERSAPAYEWTAMLECMRATSTELQEARALVAQQERLLDKARADATPNIETLFIPYYDSPTREMRYQAYVAAQLPIFNRNQGNILAARADVARAQAEERQLELRLTDRLTAAFQRYQAAGQQVDAYRKTIIPEARESLKLIEAGYRLGDPKYDYTAVLQAQQVLFQAQLSQTQAMGELWRGVAEIGNILQQADLSVGCGIRTQDQPGRAADENLSGGTGETPVLPGQRSAAGRLTAR